ncbi:MAG: hypothetical protein IKY26_09925 [Erysipelotrichaceae bacterium]|nr:hypothetical protein [Erysipelotrichaceae bacterium]
MEVLTQSLLELVSSMNDSVKPYSDVSLGPLQSGNDIVARILLVDEKEYVNRTKRSVQAWILGKHEDASIAIDELLKIEKYLVQQGVVVVQSVQWETTSDDGKDVYSLICKLSN